MAALCTNCHKHPAKHSAASFPTVNLCRECVGNFIEDIWTLGVADGNPLIAEFWFETLRITCRLNGGSKPIRGFKLVPC